MLANRNLRRTCARLCTRVLGNLHTRKCQCWGNACRILLSNHRTLSATDLIQARVGAGVDGSRQVYRAVETDLFLPFQFPSHGGSGRAGAVKRVISQVLDVSHDRAV